MVRRGRSLPQNVTSLFIPPAITCHTESKFIRGNFNTSFYLKRTILIYYRRYPKAESDFFGFVTGSTVTERVPVKGGLRARGGSISIRYVTVPRCVVPDT